MKFIEAIGAELVKEGKIKRIERYTEEFTIFMMNIRLSLLLPTLRYGLESDPDYGAIDYISINKLAIANIVTSLEAYYSDIVIKLSKLIILSDANESALNKFLKKFNCLNDYNMDDNICEIFPNYLTFQNKDVIKICANLVNLDPIGNYHREWEETFSKNKEDSTVTVRHNFIHNGIDFSFNPMINEEFVQQKIKYALILVRNLEEQINAQYPQIMLDNHLNK